jgi:predicted amidohydrolase YtcJ
VARTLYRGARVLSPGPGGQPDADLRPAAADVLVEDGVILGLAPGPDAAGARVVDLGGALVTPAFVDAHVHVTETALLMTGVDLAGSRSVTEVLDRVARHAAATPGAVLGHGWDELDLAEGRPPTAAELERAAPGRVVYLSRVDVHSALVSPALAAAAGCAGLPGWDAGGRVERDAHHAARGHTRAAISPAERERLQRLALRGALAAGIGEVHELPAPHIAPEEDLVALAALAGGGEVLPRVVPYRGALVADAAEARDVAKRFREAGVDLAGLAGDIIVDGAVGSWTACFHEPYADRPGHRGHLYLDAGRIAAHVAACTEAGLQAGFHVIGDAAVTAVLDGFEAAADRVGAAAVRAGGHRLEHVEAVTAADVARLAALGVTASVQPAFDAAWGGPDGMYATRLGRGRAAVLNPFAAFAAGGVPLAFGSDSPITPFDPWGAVRAAVLHREPRHRIGLAAALTAHTAGGVRAGGRDGGVLAPGAEATFAVWDTGRLPDLAAGEPAPSCTLTVVAGREARHDVSA